MALTMKKRIEKMTEDSTDEEDSWEAVSRSQSPSASSSFPQKLLRGVANYLRNPKPKKQKRNTTNEDDLTIAYVLCILYIGAKKLGIMTLVAIALFRQHQGLWHLIH